MKSVLLSAVTALLFCSGSFAASFSDGDLLIVRVGDGTATLANTAGPMSILDVNGLGVLSQPAILIPSGNGGLQTSGTATSEGALVMNGDASSWTVAGYVPPFGGSGNLSGRSAANAPRGYVTISSSGNVSSTTTLPGSGTYSTQNIRSGLAAGTGIWFTGSGTSSGNGLVYSDGSTSTTIQGVNSRVLGLRTGDLSYSTGAGVQGIYKFSGTPSAPTTATPFLTGVTGQGTSPYDFVIAPDGNSLYVADDNIGVQKFVFNGSSWSLAYNFSSSVTGNKGYGLAVDFTGANPTVYWTTPSDLWKATDLGAAGVGTSILSAGPSYAFRGLDMVPSTVPEPAFTAIILLGAALLFVRKSARQI
jgi:hypothetical protein